VIDMDVKTKVEVKRMVLDVLKPREVSLLELSKSICAVKGINEVNIVVTEVDVKTETMRVTVRGDDVRYEDVSGILSDAGCAIRSIDELDISKKAAVK